MNREASFEAAFLKALKKLEDADNDLARLPVSVRTFLLVHGAQGVIDNGGYAYFFEEDWPGSPAYAEFISAYETIGCRQQANELLRVVETFPCADPHLDKNSRRAFIRSHFEESTCSVRGWGNALCGDEEVWKKLVEYYEAHENDFA